MRFLIQMCDDNVIADLNYEGNNKANEPSNGIPLENRENYQSA